MKEQTGSRYEDHMEGLGSFIKLITATVIVIYTSHLIACMWHLVGSDELDNRGHMVQGWIHSEWPESIGNESSVPLGERYLVAMYWSITTLSTVGFVTTTSNLSLFSLSLSLSLSRPLDS